MYVSLNRVNSVVDRVGAMTEDQAWIILGYALLGT